MIIITVSHSLFYIVIAVHISGNKLFSFEDHEVDFYLPQLLNMYIHMHDVAEAIHPYLVHRLVFVYMSFYIIIIVEDLTPT